MSTAKVLDACEKVLDAIREVIDQRVDMGIREHIEKLHTVNVEKTVKMAIHERLDKLPDGESLLRDLPTPPLVGALLQMANRIPEKFPNEPPAQWPSSLDLHDSAREISRGLEELIRREGE